MDAGKGALSPRKSAVPPYAPTVGVSKSPSRKRFNTWLTLRLEERCVNWRIVDQNKTAAPCLLEAFALRFPSLLSLCGFGGVASIRLSVALAPRSVSAPE